jgi:hypothetical protein
MDELTGQTVELLQTLIRNACVNEGTVESGQEIRNAEVLATYLEGSGADVELFHAAPGRTSLVARIEGTDPDAPSLCLNGHTDVVPVTPEGWSRDPFAGELVDGEMWGRGAVDMLNLTASMAVALRHLADVRLPSPRRPRLRRRRRRGVRQRVRCPLARRPPRRPDHDRLRAHRERRPARGIRDPPHRGGHRGREGRGLAPPDRARHPGHGSMPFGADNALVKAAGVVQRLADYRPRPASTSSGVARSTTWRSTTS